MAKKLTKTSRLAAVRIVSDGTVIVDDRLLTRQAMVRERRAQLLAELTTGKLRAKTIPAKRRHDADWRREVY
jgi:hypothetical protein